MDCAEKKGRREGLKEILREMITSTYGVKDPAILEILISNITVKEYHKGDVLVRHGDEENDLLFLLDGVARMYLVQGADEITLSFAYKRGSWVRMSPALKDPVSIGEIEMITDGRIASISVQKYIEVAEKYPMLFLVYAREISRSLDDRCEEKLMLNLSKEQRYEWFLEKHPGLIDKVAHYKIASYLGMSPVSLSRARGERGETRKRS